MNNKNIIILLLQLIIFPLFNYGETSNNIPVNRKEIIYKLKSDTLTVSYTYWWPNSGPFIGNCGNEYSLVFLGTISEIQSQVKDKTKLHTSQKGIVKIEEVLKTKNLSKGEYNGHKYFVSDCFYGSGVKKGDKVIVFCYEYEGSYNIPGKRSIIKIDEFNDPIVTSTKIYIESNQDPIKIKKDIELWEKKGFGIDLKQIIECAEIFDNNK